MCSTAQISKSIGGFTGSLEVVFSNIYKLNFSINKIITTAKRSESTSRSTDNNIQLNQIKSRLKRSHNLYSECYGFELLP